MILQGVPWPGAPCFVLGRRSSERGTANLGSHGLSFVCQQVLANALKQLDRVHQLYVGKTEYVLLYPPSFSHPQMCDPFP